MPESGATAFAWSSLVVPACALVAIGLLYAAIHPPMRKNARREGTSRQKKSGRLSKNKNKKRSMAARGILVVPESGL